MNSPAERPAVIQWLNKVWPPFLTAPLLWILVVVSGAFLNQWLNLRAAEASHHWQAAAALPRHHQLRQEDLQQPARLQGRLPPASAFVGLHLLSDKEEGQAILAGDLSPAPQVTPGADNLIYIYTIDDEELPIAYALRPGVTVQLCALLADDEATGCVSGLTVVAIHVATDQAPHNWLVVQLPQDNAPGLAPLLSGEKRFLLIESQ